ncbi:MAG: nucleotidyltransferase domain-containing protein [Deltaproteobacteria bacterium]|nr:nucleotidyltransferase domain-containing protein [Deltaproteobacteria bacterium]
MEAHPSLGEWAILSAYRGSIAHGLYVPSADPNSIDDKDVMAVCVPPLDYYFGLKEFGSRGTKEIKQNEWDIVVYEVRKFIRLLARGNPNVLMMLWLDRSDYLKVTEAGRLLLDNRQIFVGRHVYQAFAGYARSQLYKMTHLGFQGYMGAKRKNLVERYGYDCKNAAHLIRLLRMGIEFLRDGQLQVRRHDAEQLLAIKRGEWTLEQVKAEAEQGFQRAEEAYSASPLPPGPDMDRINELAVETVRLALEARN